MTGLSRRCAIDPAALRGADYFRSLVVCGHRSALLTDGDIARMQAQCLSLLAKRAEAWSCGKSSSIRTETAQELLSSILFTLGVALKAFPCPEDAVDALRQSPLERLFYAGLQKIRRKVQIAQLTHKQLVRQLFRTQNVFYRSTAVDAISGFFKLYRPEFFAHQIHITADYPVFLAVDDLAGIEFIERYLRHIAYENRFCLYFPPDRVHRLLCGLHEGYRQVPMNLYEPVLAAALCCVLTRQPLRALSCDLDAARALFGGNSAGQIECLLRSALEQMIAALSCTPGLAAYLRSSLPGLAALIGNAMQLGHLEAVVPIPARPNERPGIPLLCGARMTGSAYVSVLEELMQREDAEKKAGILLHKIHSPDDLPGILRDCAPAQAPGPDTAAEWDDLW